jgi:uncharacterized protein YjbI with pentapeptide repeats
MKITITERRLIELGACAEGLEWFNRYVDPRTRSLTLTWTKETQLNWVANSGLHQWFGWAVRSELLPCWGMRGADLRHADLRHADLRPADLTGADLRHADLTGADLTGADLRHANLRYVDFYNAVLYRANLRYANLTGANLTGANLTGAIGVKR